MAVAADVALRQAVAQPAGALADELDAGSGEADLLVELAIERLLRLLAEAHSALGELPAASAGAATEEDALAVHQHYGHVAAKAVGIDMVAHRQVRVCHSSRTRREPTRAALEGWRFPTNSLRLTP